jgi:cobalamin biosynthesis Co2+ chelatase CbiK
VESRQLGATIKREYQRKVEAAVKIQKVFRGYLTRKVLQRCMEREQERLQTRLLALRPQIFANV